MDKSHWIEPDEMSMMRFETESKYYNKLRLKSESDTCFKQSKHIPFNTSSNDMDILSTEIVKYTHTFVLIQECYCEWY